MDASEIAGTVDAYAQFLEEIVHAQDPARPQLRVLLEDITEIDGLADAGRCPETIEAVRKSFVGARWVLLAEQRLRHRLRGSSTLESQAHNILESRARALACKRSLLLRRRRHRQMDGDVLLRKQQR